MTMLLRINGENTPEKHLVHKSLRFDPMLSQDPGSMNGRTVEQLSYQSNSGIGLFPYQQRVSEKDDYTSFFEQRDVQCIIANTCCLSQDHEVGVFSPTLNLFEGSLDELRSGQDSTQIALSKTSYITNKRVDEIKKKVEPPSKQRVCIEKDKVEWTADVVNVLIQAVNTERKEKNNRKNTVNWKLVTAKVSDVAKTKIDHRVCRNAYCRKLNPNLKPLTPEIKEKIEACLIKGQFMKPNGSIYYAQLAEHFEVADDKLRKWIFLGPKSKGSDFLKEFRRKEKARLAKE
jgi:hypothetical protein